MVRKSVVFLVLLAVLSTQFSMYFVFAGFELNRQYIAAKLCENRNRPELNCKGKCYLKNKLRQALEKERQQEKQNHKNLMQETLQHEAFVFRCLTLRLAVFIFPQSAGFPVSRAQLIFQPPEFGKPAVSQS